MMDWFALALEKAQAEGKNPTLAELIDMSVYMEDVSNRNIKLEAIGCLKDFVDMSERVLHKAAEIEATGREIDTLRRLCEVVRKEIPDNGE